MSLRRRSWLVPSILAFGFAFLYVPILSMIVFSFNNSRLVTVWDSAHSPTLKWYGALMRNHQILDAAWLSQRSMRRCQRYWGRSWGWCWPASGPSAGARYCLP